MNTEPISDSRLARASGSAPINLHSPLTLRNAFLFPVQHRAARRDLLIGGLLLLVLPGIGWILNMGHRLRIVNRMQRSQDPHPAWHDFGGLLWHGSVTGLLIFAMQFPAILFAAAAWLLDAPIVYVPAAMACLCGTFLLPGFMTFYARNYDINELLRLGSALRRVRGGGTDYLHAWLIALAAMAASFLGLLAFGIGFAVTSVWFWQVAAFSFANVFSHQHQLLDPPPAPTAVPVPAS